jgi:hypothetical protein
MNESDNSAARNDIDPRSRINETANQEPRDTNSP